MVRQSADGPCACAVAAAALAVTRRKNASVRIMFRRLLLVTATFVIALGSAAQNTAKKTMLVIHGGAGTITRQSMTGDLEKQYREGLEQALRAGHAVLAKGGSSVDAV